MNFRTRLQLDRSPQLIAPPDQLLGMGSCFADQMGAMLDRYKFKIEQNPFGVLFNPLAISRWFDPALTLPESGVVALDGAYAHLWAHSAWCAPTHEAVLDRLYQAHARFHDTLARVRWLLLTWGTAWVYDHPSAGTVANCHRQPAAHFQKRLLSVSEVLQATETILDALPAQAQIILTVSPVRYLRDTLPLNAVSKSVLRLAAHQWEQAEARVHYFPAYELLLDDLRDYRFYADDLLHPSAMARQYIWERFTESWLSLEAQAQVTAWESIRRRLEHRPRQAGSPTHQAFVAQLKKDLQQWAHRCDISKEWDQI